MFPIFVDSDLLFCTCGMADVNRAERERSATRSPDAVFLLLGMLALSAAGNLGCNRLSQASNERSQGSQTPQVKGAVHLEPFVMNLSDPEENRFLRVGIDLGVEKPLSAREGKGGEGEVPIARTRDCILGVLSSWRSDALLAPEGKQKLKDELVHALQDHVPELRVKEVYFTDFLVQL